jgi:aspartate/methionine/tyrosine aminotransferase
MIAALEKQEETDRFIRNMVDTFKERRDLIVGELNSMKGIRCKKPDGAFYVFPNIERTGMSSQQFSDYLVERADITTVPGVVFGENGEGHLRISYATSQIKQGMNRMKIAVKPLL